MAIKITQASLIVLACLLLSACSPSQEKARQRALDLRKKTAEAMEKNEINDELALKAGDALFEYAVRWPDDTAYDASFLYDAMQLYTQAKNYQKALEAADSLQQRYSDSKMMPYVLHYKAYFIYENGLGDLEMAGKLYREFLEKYPDHPELTPVVLFSLENLGKKDDELMDELLKKKESAKAPS